MSIKIFFFVCLAILNIRCSNSEKKPKIVLQSWDSLVRDVGTFSSPRAIDLNQDGIKDIVFGAGKIEFQYTDSAVFALDGSDGSALWRTTARDQIFGSANFMDITNDEVPDVFIGGRSAEFMAIDGRDGKIIWEYFPQGDTVDHTTHQVYNFYNPQFIRDVDGDGFHDILVANGGYVKAGPFELNRPPGKLMIINSVTGKLITESYMPDGKETYMSAVVEDQFSRNPRIVFGSGGERIPGQLYVIMLDELLNENMSASRVVAEGGNKGFVAPPVLVDINKDGTRDIIVNAVDGKILAIDGETYQVVWELLFPGTEIYCSLAIGMFDEDNVPDFFTNIGIGSFPDLMQSIQVTISGKKGEILRLDTLGTFHYGSAVVYDLDNDGFDEILYHLNQSNMGVVKNVIQVFDINNDDTYALSESWNGANLGSTPLLMDIDGDGMIELISIHENNPIDLFSVDFKTGIEVHLIKLDIPLEKPILWGSYMGSGYDAIFK